MRARQGYGSAVGASDHDHRRRACRGRVARDRLARAERYRDRVSPARAQRVKDAAAPSRLSPVRPGARAAPATQPGMGRDHRRHREPVLHVGRPRHRRRRPRRGPPARVVQLGRRSRDRGGVHRRRRRRTDGRCGHLGRVGARVDAGAAARTRHPGRRRRPPTGARARRLRRRRQPERWGGGDGAPRRARCAAHRVHHRPEPGRHRERTVARLSGRARRRRVAAGPRRSFGAPTSRRRAAIAPPARCSRVRRHRMRSSWRTIR